MGREIHFALRLFERKNVFTNILNKEIVWCEENKGIAPDEYRRGFIAGLKQAVYIISAAKQRMVWQDGEMVDDEVLLDRADELRNEAVDAGQGMASHTEDSVEINGME
jgi:hypothetical protein